MTSLLNRIREALDEGEPTDWYATLLVVAEYLEAQEQCGQMVTQRKTVVQGGADDA